MQKAALACVRWSSISERIAEFSNSISHLLSVKQTLSAGFDDASGSNIGRFNAYSDEVEWEDLQLFKFGLMSYLLPRFLMMMNADESFYDDFAQWTGNNTMPSDPLTGQRFNDWYEVKRKSNDKRNKTDYARVANIPSQAVWSRRTKNS